MSDEVAGERAGEVLDCWQDQLTDIAAMQKKQAALRVKGRAADGLVEVTVNARGQLVKAVIDESYLDDHGLEDIGGFISEAAQLAAREAADRVAELLAPINERHKLFSESFSDIVDGVPGLRNLLPPGMSGFGASGASGAPGQGAAATAGYDNGDASEFIVMRR